ncbi:LuxR family two component transcriptional regulator [Kribbella amoyensis]|uniref:LuxR family two component transcriptional regulator n=1 Tax=Kribbella amoyensis TaxID=996641 RepID=A0A561BMU5_9ACTN|nr:response regulator transcription factor [Kribbella amoyensis]TWD80173.1 LuxR family two component transcriptional regulator [Kribbella amoyensis]
MSGETAVRLIVCDDHQVFAEALAAVLSAHGYYIAAVVNDPAQLLELLRQDLADLCVLDLSFPDADGLEVAAQIAALDPEIRIFVLTARTGSEVLRKAVSAGARGVASKERGIDDILTAIGRVAGGEIYCDDNLLRDALGLSATRQSQAQFLASYVTPREHEVLTYLVAGMTTEGISRRMGISKTTVRAHVQSILSKFGVHSRLEAVSYAIANKVIEPPGHRG